MTFYKFLVFSLFISLFLSLSARTVYAEITPYGYIRANMAYTDSGQITYDNGDRLFYVNGENGSVFALHARQTRLGIKSNKKLSDTSDIMGLIEVDFYHNENNALETKVPLRLRKAAIHITSGDTTFVLGQEGDIISPLYPTMLDFAVGLYGGNTGWRRPQFRVEHEWDKFKLQGSINRASLNRENNGSPDLQIRGSYNSKQVTVGLGYMAGKEADVALPGIPTTKFDVHLLVGDIKFKTGNLLVKGEIYSGRNCGDYFSLSGIDQDETGGWIDLGISLDDKNTVSIGASGTSIKLIDRLIVAQRVEQQLKWINLIHKFTKDFSMGLEYKHHESQYHNTADFNANRFEMMFNFTI